MCGMADVARRHDHRRHRARPHRQGRGLPARRDEGRRLPGHLPHGRDRARGLAPAARRPGRARTRSTSTPRPRTGCAKAGYIIGRLQRVIFYDRGRQGHQLERHRAGRRPGRRRAPLGLPALLQGGPALDQLAGPDVRRHAAGDRRRPALPRPTSGPAALRLDANGFLGVEKSAEGTPGLVGGPPAVRGGEPAHRQHGAQGRRLHLPGAEPHHRRHQAAPPSAAPTCPTTSSTGPPTTTPWPPATPSSCGSRLTCARASASTPPRSCTPCRTTTS